MIFLCKENFNMRLFYYLSTCQTCKRIIKDLDLNDSIQKIDIKKTPINNNIRAAEVMLIDENGNKKGLLSINEALSIAESSSLDLVQVSPQDSNPIVCKLLDYGKHLFNKKKKKFSQKLSNQH